MEFGLPGTFDGFVAIMVVNGISKGAHLSGNKRCARLTIVAQRRT